MELDYCNPPEALIHAPLTHPASSEAKKTAIRPISRLPKPAQESLRNELLFDLVADQPNSARTLRIHRTGRNGVHSNLPPPNSIPSTVVRVFTAAFVAA